MATATKSDLQEIKDLIKEQNQKITQLEQKVDEKIDKLDQKITQLEQKVDEKIDKLDQKITQLEQKVEQKIDKLDQKIDRIENKVDEIDRSQLQIKTRLEDWKPSFDKIPDLAEKVGELKNWRSIALVVVSGVITTLFWFFRNGKL
jgi:DNA repair exonuclease SbcCD ATPase subunit